MSKEAMQGASEFQPETDLEQDAIDMLAEEKPKRGRPPKNREPEETDVSQRRRGKMAAGKRPTLREVPVDLIERAMEHHHQIVARVKRRSPRGHLAYLGEYTKDTVELMDIEVFLKETLGGGKYRIEPFCADGSSGYAEPLVPFEVEIAGPVKAQRASDIDHSGVTASSATPAYVDPRHLSPFVRGLPVDQQIEYAKQQGIPVSNMSSPHMPAGSGPFSTPVASFPSDKLAADQLRETKEELQRERRERERERQEYARQQRDAAKRLESLEQQWRDEKLLAERKEHDFKLEALKAEMARDREQMKMMLEQRSQQKPTLTGESIAAMLTGVAPVVTALIESSNSRQTKSMEMQTQGVQNLLQATMAKADHKPLLDVVKTVAPIAGPLLTSFWESKSPSAQADLVASMAENNLTQIGMMTQLIEQFSQSQGDPPWWLPMVQQSLQGVMQTAEAVMGDKRRQPSQQQQTQQPQQPSQAQQQTPGMAMAQQILSNPACPEWCKNEEWARALVAIHDQQPVGQVAQYISNLFRQMDAEGRTPPALEKFWDAADEMLVEFLQPLPIWVINEQYAKDLIERIIEICSTEEDVPPAQEQVQARGEGWSATPASSFARPYSAPEPAVSSAPPKSPDGSQQQVEVTPPTNGVSQRPFVETDAETLDLHAFSEPEKAVG